MKRIFISILTAALLLTAGACGKKAVEPESVAAPQETAMPTGAIPAPVFSEEPSAAPSLESDPASGGPAEEPAVAPEPTPEPTPEPALEESPEPAPEPTERPVSLPLTPGTFVGSDGSLLTVKEDGTCTFETTLTGTVNGIRAEGRVTFHGTVDGGVFTFTKVMYYGLDVTEIGRASGYSDYTYWQDAAAVIYAGGI